MRKPVHGVSGELGSRDTAEHAFDQTVAQRGQVRRVLRQVTLRDADGFRKPDDAGDILRPGAAVGFGPPPPPLREKPANPAHPQPPPPPRALQRVAPPPNPGSAP